MPAIGAPPTETVTIDPSGVRINDPEFVIDAKIRQNLIRSTARLLRNTYVDPQIGGLAADTIERSLRAGAYENFKTSVDLARRLSSDLYQVTHDKHLRFEVADPVALPLATLPPPKSEGGVVRADRLSGNVGYIEIVSFPPKQSAGQSLDRAMANMQDTKALIIDLRRNLGGYPDTVAYFLSFFFNSHYKKHLIDFRERVYGSDNIHIIEFFTSATPTSYLDKPIYILTSASTFSGAEMVAYVMQSEKRGVVVGERTGGGANGIEARIVTGGRFVNLKLALPIQMARSPLTGSNWEGSGVIPDWEVPADDSLKVSLERLGEAPNFGAIEKLSQVSLFNFRTKPRPGAETALRRYIEGVANGQPPLDLLTPEFAEGAKRDVASVRYFLKTFLPIGTMTFAGPNADGLDCFIAEGPKATKLLCVNVTAQGKLDGYSATFLPESTSKDAAIRQGP